MTQRKGVAHLKKCPSHPFKGRDPDCQPKEPRQTAGQIEDTAGDVDGIIVPVFELQPEPAQAIINSVRTSEAL